MNMDSGLTACLAGITRRLDVLTRLPAQVGETKESIQMSRERNPNSASKAAESITSLNVHVGKLEAACASGSIQQLRAIVNDLEFRSRKLNIGHGNPATPNKDLPFKRNDVAKSVVLLELTVNDIDANHRRKPDKTPGICVRLFLQSIRDK